MAFRVYYSESIAQFPVEIQNRVGTFLHFLDDKSKEALFDTQNDKSFDLRAPISDLFDLFNKDICYDSQVLFEKFNQFSYFIDDEIEKNKGDNRELREIHQNKLEYFLMKFLREALGMDSECHAFPLILDSIDCEIGCKDYNYDFMIEIFSEIFSRSPEEITEFQLIFHQIIDFSPPLLRILQILEKCNIDMIFCFYPDPSFSFSDLQKILKPLCEENQKNICYSQIKNLKNSYNVDYYLNKDLWLVNFISPILQMWDGDEKEIKINKESLKLCFHGWWFKNESGRKMWNIFTKIEPFLEEQSSFMDLLDHIDLLSSNLPNLDEDFLKDSLPIYASLTCEDYDFFISGIKKLNEISCLLFDNSNDLSKIERYFYHLHLFYKKKCGLFLELQEREILLWLDSSLNKNKEHSPLLAMLQDKISLISQTKSNFIPEDEGERVVFPFRYYSIYDVFLNSKYVQVYKSFSKKESCLNYENKLKYQVDTNEFSLKIKTNRKTLQISYDRYHTMSFFLCPFRYVSTFLLQEKICINERILYLKCYENILVMKVWREIEGKKIDEIHSILLQIDEKYHIIFPFFSWKERFDVILRAKNYLTHSIAKPGVMAREYAFSHMEMKLQFGEAFFNDVGSIPPLPSFLHFVRKKYHSLHHIPKSDDIFSNLPLRQEMTDYLNNNIDIYRQGTWCKYCNQKKNCKKTFDFP